MAELINPPKATNPLLNLVFNYFILNYDTNFSGIYAFYIAQVKSPIILKINNPN